MIDVTIDLKALAAEPDAGIVLCWVMAANDLHLTMYLRNHFADETNTTTQTIRYAGRHYNDRLAIGIAAEAISMCVLSEKSAFFNSLLATNPEALQTFMKLADLERKPVSEERRAINKTLQLIRNHGMFHYFDSGKPILRDWMQWALSQHVREFTDVGRASIDNTGDMTRFHFADDAFTMVFTRKLMECDVTDHEKSQARVSEVVENVATLALDVLVVGDHVGKELLRRFPLPR